MEVHMMNESHFHTQMNNGTTDQSANCVVVLTAYDVSFATLTLIILLLQAFVLWLCWKKSSLRVTPVNNVLISLAVTDALTGVSLFIKFVFNLIQCESKPTRRTVISAQYILSNFCLFSAVGHLLLFSTERLISIEYALTYRKIVTKKRIMTSVYIVYVVSIILPSLEAILIFNISAVNRNKIYFAISFGVLIVLAITIMILQNGYLFYKIFEIKRDRPDTREKKSVFKNRRTFFIYLAMFVSFLMLTAPYYIIKIMIIYKKYNIRHNKTLRYTFMIMRYLVSVVNPLIYSLNKKDFRKAIKKIVRDFWVRKRSETYSFSSLVSAKIERQSLKNAL